MNLALAKKKVPQTREEMLEQTIEDIRGKFGQGSIMRLGDNARANVEVIPSGILPLNIALGVGGYPKGRIVEIFGPEGSGKTTVALYAIAEAQRAGGVAAFIDAEHALDPRLAAALGVDVEALYLSQPDSGEQALYVIGESQLGLQARLMSYALRRLTSIVSKTNCVVIFINQLRALISTGYGAGPTETTTGGRALKFYSSVRLEVRRGKKIEKGEETIGHELYLKVVKNKLAPPFRSAHTSLIYGKGIPMGVAVVDMAVDYEVIRRKGSWLSYKGETLGQGKEAVAQFLEKNPSVQEEIIREIMAEVARGIGFQPQPSLGEDPDAPDAGAEGAVPPEVDMLDGPMEIEEGILDLSDDDK